MEILKTIITIIFVIDCIALSAIILLQEGKSAGLGTISGQQIHIGDRTRDVLWKVHL
mgnify:CR=1 FL=1